MDKTGREEIAKTGITGTESITSMLRAFGIGALMALAWGVLTHVSGLERLFANQAQERLFSIPLPAQVVLYVFVSPVAEEFLFRRLLFDLVCKAARRKTAAIIVSALFALWHGNVFQMLYAFPAGLILQEMRSRSGRMAEPVCCHIGANLTAVLVNAAISFVFQGAA